MRSYILGVVGCLVLTTVVGCKKKDEGQDAQSAGYYQQQPGGYQQQPGGYQQQPGGYQQQPGGYQQQPGGYQQPPPQNTGTAQQPPPGLPGMPPAGSSGGQAQPVDPSLGAAATPILNQLATAEAMPGAKPMGSALVGNFQQGQTLETQIQLNAGKCYTVVAAGVVPVSEVNVKFVAVTPIPGSAMVLAQDQTTGPQAVLGKKPNCYKNPAPFGLPVKLVLEVAGGSGIAAAQVYEK
ncbi:MAG: hypothetical protein R3B13_16055 [Polyangiaceae bacterium]